MTKKLFSVMLSLLLTFSLSVCVIGAEGETTEIYTFNCSDGTNDYTDLSYGLFTGTTDPAKIPAYFEKTISVPVSGNYTFSVNVGLLGDGKLDVYIERVKGQVITISKTGDLATVENRVIFTDVPLEADVQYTVTIANNTSGSQIRIKDLVFEKSGEYLPDTDYVKILASDYSTKSYTTASVCKKHMQRMIDNSNATYVLNPGAGNYRVYASLKSNTGKPTLETNIITKENGTSKTTKVGTYSGPYSGSHNLTELGIINVSDGAFTLKFNIPDTSTTMGIYVYYLVLEAIDEPVVSVHSGEEATYSNVLTNLAEGIMTAKAYLPKEIANKSVTVLFAIYDEAGSLYKVEKTTVESASENQVVNVTINDVAFEEGKTYTSKVFFLNDMVNIQALYKNPAGGNLVSAIE